MEQRESQDLNDVRPSSIGHIVGQQHVVKVVSVALDAAQMDGKRFDHAMLVGPPGCGKTTVAHLISKEMASPFIEVLGQQIRTMAELNAMLLAAKEDRTIIFIDEAAELDKSLQIAIYMALDQRKIVVAGSRLGSSPVSIPLSDITLLLATTHEAELLPPLRDRMRIVLRFQFYSQPELAELVRLRSRALGWNVEEDVLPEIAKRSRGTPRLALRLLMSARRCARSAGEKVVTPGHLRRACDLEQIDALGLGPTDQKYLSALSEGALRLNVLCSILGIDSKSVSEVVEPYLLRANLIVKDEQSRRNLTALGREHLANLGTTVD